MAENSKIEWTDHTFNPWIGCTKVSPGCAHCYAETQDKFRSWTPDGWGKGKPRKRASSAMWKQPLKWQLSAADAVFEHDSAAPFYDEGDLTPPRRPRVFCASLADWLDDEVPIEWLADLLALIHTTPNLDWLMLTKRPQNWRPRMRKVVGLSCVTGCMPEDKHGMAGWLANRWTDAGAPPNNVWIGTSVEDQQRSDERIPLLLDIPARIRFLSCEPLLGPVDLRPDMGGERAPVSWLENGCTDERIHWVIAGGESGSDARPMHPDWARSLRDQCQAAGAAFLFKQWGEWSPCPIGNGPDLVTDAVFKRGPGLDGAVWRVGKAKAGRELDGYRWNQFPGMSCKLP